MKKILATSLLMLSFGSWGGNTFNTLDAAPSVSIGAGASLIGKVGIDQTTPGTTNAVQANAGTNLNTSALALDATLVAQSAKLPASLGIKASAASLSIAPSSDGNWLSDGTTGGNVVAGDSGQNAVVVASSRKEVSFTTTTAQAVASTDVGNYGFVSIHVVTQGGSSTVNFQQSNDNTNWLTLGLIPYNNGTNAIATSTASAGVIYSGPLTARYFRLNVTGIVSGTTAGVVEFSAASRPMTTLGVTSAQSGTWTVQPGNTANTTPWLTSPQSSATGGYSFSNLKANATTTVKSGAGTLHTISINTKGLTNTVTVYDNTAGSGTTIATIDTTLGQDTLTFDLAFATGLTIVIAGGTAADITVTYK